MATYITYGQGVVAYGETIENRNNPETICGLPVFIGVLRCPFRLQVVILVLENSSNRLWGTSTDTVRHAGL
jgi:hypothetical protein